LTGALLFLGRRHEEFRVRPAIRRPINPAFWTCIERSGLPKTKLAADAGWPHYSDFYATIHSTQPRITPLTLLRLQRVAHAVQGSAT
jgi:hypothetical protein